jgi:hypothetical protein
MVGDWVPDPVEIGEGLAERWADENIEGDQFRCADCGVWGPLEDMHPSSANPYSVPICGSCLDIMLKEMEGR